MNCSMVHYFFNKEEDTMTKYVEELIRIIRFYNRVIAKLKRE